MRTDVLFDDFEVELDSEVGKVVAAGRRWFAVDQSQGTSGALRRRLTSASVATRSLCTLMTTATRSATC